ncbi:hypothetical protein BDP27DRAFT_1361270 [Rhodocollybia butyracea]|uniref:Uncharacterized protein n=1 Tax=Rhodocollybia butyracea TaxID=206335 RepID=A0A9P5UAN5_9AGAR|nr:hypothetical protein BDP27DRAFT_1361270 [Rhodocollybia butyracea]
MYRGNCLLTKHVTLSNFHFPLLAELDIGTFDECEDTLPELDCFEHALRLCTLGTSEVPTSKVPYHQLRCLELWDSHSSLVEILHRCPSVKSLGLVGWEDYDPESSTHYMSRNITSLTITKDYDSYLELVLLTFNLPLLSMIVLDSHDEAPEYWPTETFISFISRESSCMITTFTLRSISLSDLDFLAALQVMPSLLHLEIEGYQRVHPPDQYSPITSNLISRLIQHEYTSTSLVPKLHTLHLVSQYNNGTFDNSAFVNMVKSRWFRPGSDRFAAMSIMGRSCIRSVVLKFDWREVDAEVYKPVRNLDNEGLRVVVAGTNGF